MDIKRFYIQFYHYSAKYFQLFGIGLAVLIAAWIFTLRLPVKSSHAIVVFSLYLLLPLLVISFGIAWVRLWAWYYTWFRYIVYGGAIISRFIRKFLANWFANALLCLLAALAFQSRRFLLLGWDVTLNEVVKELLEFRSLIRIFITALLFMLLYQVIKSRKRLVISRFENHTGLEEMDSAVNSVGTRILNEMVRLHDLLQDIDEINPLEKNNYLAKKGIIGSTLTIQDIGKNLEEMIGPQSRVVIGSFLTIPLDLIYAFIIRLMQGRVLKGSLHKNGDKLIITARLRGGRFNETWRVNSEDLEPPWPSSRTQMLVRMTEQLVCRIFTTLAENASPRWRAVKYYTKGLRLYRETVGTEVKRKINLLRAQQEFIRSIREDDRFAQCYYNLGIVYTELGNHKAAEATFRQGITMEPDNFDCCFKMALLYFNNHKEPQDTRWLCGEARTISPRHPSPWNLMGASYFEEWKKKKQEMIEKEPNPSHEPHPGGKIPAIDENAIIAFRNASVLAWKQLCLYLKMGVHKKKGKMVAAICLFNLANALARRKRPHGVSTFRQSLFLAPHDNEVYYGLGKLYFRQKKMKRAFNAFLRVFQEDENVDTARFWALHSHTCARLYETSSRKGKALKNRNAAHTYKEIIKNNCVHLFNAVADFIQENPLPKGDKHSPQYKELARKESCFFDNLELMKTALNSIRETEKAKCLDYLRDLRDYVDKAGKSRSAPGHLDRILQDFASSKFQDLKEDEEWCKAQINIAGGKALIQHNNPREIERGLSSLSKAGEILNGTYSRQLERQKVSLCIAKGLFNLGKCKEALFHVRIALNQSPFGTSELHLLGDILFKLNDFRAGLKVWNISSQLEPPEPDQIEEIGKTYAEVGDKLLNAQLRRAMLDEVIAFFLQLRELMENHPLKPDEEIRGQYVIRLEAIHYYLGVFYGELLHFDLAIYHLRIALKLEQEELRVYVRLGWTYFDAKLIDKAQQVFGQAMAIFKKSGTKTNKTWLSLFVESRLGLAICRIHQVCSQGDDESLDRMLAEACADLQRIEETEVKDRLSALYYECQGQMTLKKVPDRATFRKTISNKYKEPIKIFEQSVARKPTARVYYYLADTYWKYSQTLPLRKRESLMHNVRRAADLCTTYDTRGQYSGAAREWYIKGNQEENRINDMPLAKKPVSQQQEDEPIFFESGQDTKAGEFTPPTLNPHFAPGKV